MDAQLNTLVRIQQAHHRQLLAVQDLSGELVGAAWDAYADLNNVGARQFTAAATTIVEQAAQRTTTLAAGYLQANDKVLGRRSSLDIPVPAIRGGVPPADVYQRSIVEARRLVAAGAPPERALAAGRARAVGTAQTDVILTNKGAIDLGRSGRPWVVGYRRVLTGKSCGLCATASTQRYHSADLQPIHQRCDCDTAEIYGTKDPGRVINRDLLESLKAGEVLDGNYVVDEVGTIRKRSVVTSVAEDGTKAARVEAGPELRARVHEHGEVGPVLTDASHEFTAASDLAASGESPSVAAAEEARAGPSARRGRPKVDDPDVIATAEKHGVTPEELVSAERRLGDVRKALREEAARVQAESFAELDRWDAIRLRRPPPRGKRGAQWDWLERIDDRELARFSRIWYTDAPAYDPDLIAFRMSHALNRELSVDEAMDIWLRESRRYEAAGSLRRGKIPSERAYSGRIDVDSLIAPPRDIAQVTPSRILDVDDLEAAGHLASVERTELAEDARQLLGAAADARHGPKPYRMSFESWQGEVSDLEFAARNHPETLTPDEWARLDELVPTYIDEPGASFEELYARIVTTARRAGEEVPDHVSIDWQG